MDEPWRSAFYKQPIDGPARVERETIVGDGVADRKNHGGPDKAILGYSHDHYANWQRNLRRPEMTGGAFGENLTLAGTDEDIVCVGDVYQLGEVELEVSQPRQPCWKLGRRWRMKELPLIVMETGQTGWYFRVRKTGTIEAGLSMELLDRPFPNLTITALNDMMYGRSEATREAAECPALFTGWRNHLWRNLQSP